MRHSWQVGFSFGVTSGIVTTLGLMIGLYAGTYSRLVVIGGILTIAIADAFSDALGIHISEESEDRHLSKDIWISTISTLFSKFTFSLTFIIPVLLFPLSTAIMVNVIWGLSILVILSYKMARKQKVSPLKVVGEHLVIAVMVITLTYYLGKWVAVRFG